jgi:hypothetical protein
MDIFANICGGRVSEDVQYPERSELAAGAATPPLRAHHLEEHMRRLEGHTKATPHKKQSRMPAKPNVSFASAVSPSVVAKSVQKHSSSNNFDQRIGSVDLNEYQLAERDHWETRSDDTAATSEMDDTKKQLEELQIRTIFSLVEPVEIEFESKTMKKKILFITQVRLHEHDSFPPGVGYHAAPAASYQSDALLLALGNLC